MLRFEHDAWTAGYRRVAGVDEAGRGPLAGPVVAAAVVFDAAFLEAEEQGCLQGLTDSKRMTEKARERFFALLHDHPSVQAATGYASPEEIDSINILRATHLAMRRAVVALEGPVDFILVDGRPVPELPASSRSIVGGDGLSLSIAAASVVAKVTRDATMRELDRTYPGYGFAAHKGYGTRAHLDALRRLGPTPCHRRSFRPVSQLLLDWS